MAAEKEQRDIHATTGDITAQNGAVAIGTAADGTTIIVYNISVDNDAVKALLRDSDLTEEEAASITFEFLNYTAEYYRYLPLKGMGPNSGLRLNFPLVELFIPLNARLALPDADILPDNLRVAGRALAEEELQNMRGGMSKPHPVLDLLRDHPVLVILGDPGSGKSTVLKFLALITATGQGTKLGLDGFLPLFLPLAAYSEALAQDSSLSLYGFIETFFAKRLNMNGLDNLLRKKLAQGRVLIMLDGLDEVKETGLRSVVVKRVQSFVCQYIDKGNRVIMTSRIIGYREVRPPEVKGLRECTLLDFEIEEIKEFIRRWTATIERQACEEQNISNYRAEAETKELQAVMEQNRAIRKLAANPLLLTMLVVQKRQGVSLPRHRVLLYKQYVDSLLNDWLLARIAEAEVHNRDLPNERTLKKILEPIAYEMQEFDPGKGLLGEEELLTRLEPYFSRQPDPGQAAWDFVRDVREHSGLLIDRGGRKFGFLHLTFMEYLAGVFLAKKIQKVQGVQSVAEIMARYAADGEWRETLLLAIGYMGLVMELDENAADVLADLLQQSGPDAGPCMEMVGAALEDMGADGVTPEGWDYLRRELVSVGLRNPAVSAGYRVEIGAHLAEIGDPRREVMDVDAMHFCRVDAGPFFLGSTDADDFAKDHEKEGAGEYNLYYDYWLARYPVTVAQYRQFVEESGHQPKDDDCLRAPANTPVVYVTWHETMKFCDWLTERWREKGWLPEGYIVTLPSEPEWEKAAKGGSVIPESVQGRIMTIAEVGACSSPACKFMGNPNPHRVYPWDGQEDGELMNYGLQIGQVSAVGCYPQGCSTYGCEELSGNVLEWTRGIYAPYPYPQDQQERQQRETRQGDERRALRGGAFYLLEWLARCAARYRYNPGLRYNYFGFRVSLSPFTSEL